MEYLESALVVALAANFSTIAFKPMLAANLAVMAAWSTIFAVQGHYDSMLLTLFLHVQEAQRNYSRWALFIKNFNSIQALNLKTIEKNNLLTNLLPAHIITKFFQ